MAGGKVSVVLSVKKLVARKADQIANILCYIKRLNVCDPESCPNFYHLCLVKRQVCGGLEGWRNS